MRKLVIFCTAIGALFGAQDSLAQVPCPKLKTDAYLGCIKAARNLDDTKACVPFIRIDNDEIDAWVACELEAAEAQYAERRKAVLQRAASRRSGLISGVELITR